MSWLQNLGLSLVGFIPQPSSLLKPLVLLTPMLLNNKESQVIDQSPSFLFPCTYRIGRLVSSHVLLAARRRSRHSFVSVKGARNLDGLETCAMKSPARIGGAG